MKNLGDKLQEARNAMGLSVRDAADATRLRILSALAISEMCVTDISRVLGINQTTVSHQLRFLKDAGIVRCERHGKIIFYMPSGETVNEILLKGVEFLGY